MRPFSPTHDSLVKLFRHFVPHFEAALADARTDRHLDFFWDRAELFLHAFDGAGRDFLPRASPTGVNRRHCSAPAIDEQKSQTIRCSYAEQKALFSACHPVGLGAFGIRFDRVHNVNPIRVHLAR